MSRGRVVAWGAAAVAVYLVAALVTSGTGLVGVRPLYDGLAPPVPYNWIDPPPDLESDNLEPAPGSAPIPFRPEGSEARSVATGDGQCIVILPRGAFEPREGADEVRVEITPLDPEPFAEAPGELEVNGNAYRVTASYPDGTAAEIGDVATIVLRYPVHATTILRTGGEDAAWTSLGSEAAEASLQLFAETDALGVFAAAGVPQDGGGFPWLPVAVGVAGVVAAAIGYLTGVRRTRGSLPGWIRRLPFLGGR